MCVCAGRATKPTAVGEGAARAREEAEATGGGFWEADRTGGDATNSHTSCRGGQTCTFRTSDVSIFLHHTLFLLLRPCHLSPVSNGPQSPTSNLQSYCLITSCHWECISIPFYCGMTRLLIAAFIMCDCACVSPETPARGEPAAGSCSREEQGEQTAQDQLRHHQGAEWQHEETG